MGMEVKTALDKFYNIFAVHTEFQTRPLSPAEIPFYIFPVKGSMKNPYKDAMVDDF